MMRPIMRESWRTAALAALLLTACSDRTGLLVRISSSELAAPADLDGLEVQVRSGSGATFMQSYPAIGSLPQSLLVRPASGETMDAVTIQVTATSGGAFVVRRVTTAAFVPGDVRTLDITLPAACVRVACPDGVDCLDGTCGGVPPDAGPMDAGPHDGGLDTGPHDAGTDVGTDAWCDPSGGRDAAALGGGACVAAACAGSVVISQMAPRGPAGGLDEFVELYNRSTHDADVSGCEIAYYTSAGVRSVRATLGAGTVIGSHHWWLLGGPTFAGSTAPDVPTAWSTGLADVDATVSLECGATMMDTLGYGTNAMVREGTPTPPLPIAASSAYLRKANHCSTAASMASGGADADAGNGWDGDDNVGDFVTLSARTPRSSATPPRP
jgi:hypothetical protein